MSAISSRRNLINILFSLCILALLVACGGKSSDFNPTTASQLSTGIPAPTNTNTPAAASAEATQTPPPTLTKTPAPVKNSPTAATRQATKAESEETTPPPTRTPTKSPPKPTLEAQPLGNIIFTNDDSLFIMPADGSKPAEQVFTNRHDARIDLMQGISWSPDGKKVAFGKTPWSDIYIFTLGSSDAVDITPSEKFFDSEPAWSPNGKLIAFTSDRRTSKDSTNIDIYTMRTDGSGIKLLFECSGWCRHPEWSPDGKNIVFQMDDDLYMVNADGSKPRKLTNGARNEYAAWSPDGQWIAFTRSAGDNSYIYLMKPDGSGLRALTSESSGPRQLTWSPDGKFIAFENFPPSGYAGFLSIRFLNVQTGDTFDRGSGYAPSWQPMDLSKLPTPTAVPTSAVADCTSGWTRLQVGGSARVSGSTGDTPNRVRDAPSKSANQIGLLAPGMVMTLLEGPVCAEGLVFWKVASAELPGGEGWTAEGDGKEYWLEPY